MSLDIFFTPGIPCMLSEFHAGKISGAEDNPKTILVNRLMPRCVENLVRLRLSGANGIWRPMEALSKIEFWNMASSIHIVENLFDCWCRMSFSQNSYIGTAHVNATAYLIRSLWFGNTYQRRYPRCWFWPVHGPVHGGDTSQWSLAWKPR